MHRLFHGSINMKSGFKTGMVNINFKINQGDMFKKDGQSGRGRMNGWFGYLIENPPTDQRILSEEKLGENMETEEIINGTQ